MCLISDGLTRERRQQLASSQMQLRLRLLQIPNLSSLRRFAHLPRQLLWILLALRETHRELKNPPATVICHSHPLAAAVAWWFGPRVRLLMISHGDIFHRPPGSYDPAVSWLYRRTTGYAHRRAAVSVALSPVMAERIQAHGVPPERIALIPNGLDPPEIGLKEPSITLEEHWQQKPLRLLFVGRLDPVKGVDILLKALAQTRQAGFEILLDLLGEGTPFYERELVTQISQLGLSKVVTWHGPQPRSSLAEHYRICHVVVVPSLDDPLPTVILEAMACGRPVLASSVGGISFLVHDGVSGLLIPPANPHALAEAMARVDRDRSTTASLGEGAQMLSHQFSWDSNVKALEQLITPSAG
ncbi:glycosyltransferase family 4 protein [Synechococcus sp. CBW1004]|uniref:glycosyltransferase family 4 protein n=1 Tax=Synechococcus sp. CBW1004 TaxID=1353136 RepID=UPI001E3B6982|nr:glycosyltransferase family 4 protein [Synechococcus sp. CBW1004]